MSKFAAVLGLALGLGVCACAGNAGTVLTMADAGKPSEVAVGSTLTIKLPGNAGVPYQWTVTKIDSAMLGQMEPPTDEQVVLRPGGETMRTFKFIAKAPGTTRIEMAYQPSMGTATDDVRRFAADVTIK